MTITGRTYTGSIDVLESALKPGDQVVVTDNETLRDQAIVAITGGGSR